MKWLDQLIDWMFVESFYASNIHMKYIQMKKFCNNFFKFFENVSEGRMIWMVSYPLIQPVWDSLGKKSHKIQTKNQIAIEANYSPFQVEVRPGQPQIHHGACKRYQK